ncbi:unnamed protein product [Ectocarpus sp. 4 AP-2014]
MGARIKGTGAEARLKPQTKKPASIVGLHPRCLPPHPQVGFMVHRRVGGGGGRDPGADIGPFENVVGFGFLHALVSPSPLPPAAPARLGSASEDPSCLRERYQRHR